jgi:flagellar FliJ protein
MAESRAERMQVVLVLALRQEQQAGEQLRQARSQLEAETEQLRQLDDYAAQYLAAYGARKSGVSSQELIAYSGFIQRLALARREQQGRLERLQLQLQRLSQAWRITHQKTESIKSLIARLEQEQQGLLDRRLQKELDELASQAFSRKQDEF